MMSVLFNPMVASGMEPNVAWRVSMVVPAVMFVLLCHLHEAHDARSI